MSGARWLALPALIVGLLAPQAGMPQDGPAAAVLPVQMQQGYPGGGGWHWRMMQDGWHSGFGYGHWVFSLLFWGLLIAALVLGVRALSGSSSERGRELKRSALEILQERYARGEIGREEYLQRREDLESSRRP